MFVFFFFQAEDGIRDDLVTGVQTCALPISIGGHHEKARLRDRDRDRREVAIGVVRHLLVEELVVHERAHDADSDRVAKIGRASCRERVEISGVAVTLKEKKRRDKTTTTVEW